MSRALDSRVVAYELLYQVEAEDAYANLALPSLIRSHRLDSRDAGFATELAMGTLRWRGFLDAVIERASDRAIDRIDPPVRDVLRLGAYQILFMRVPDHAAVSSSVDLVGVVKYRSAGGFVNASLRRVSERDLSEWRELTTLGIEDEAQRLAVEWSHVRWQVAALRDALGARKAEIGERVRTSIQDYDWTRVEAGLRVTASIGVAAVFAPGRDQAGKRSERFIKQQGGIGGHRRASSRDSVFSYQASAGRPCKRRVVLRRFSDR